MNQPTLTTERLLLRPFRASDAKDVQSLAGDRAIADTTLHVPHPYEYGVAEAWIDTHAPGFSSGDVITFAITRRSDACLLGAVGVTINKASSRADLGYWIGFPYWNNGYCTEASESLIDYSFETLKINKITAYHLARNPASGRVMQKLGMLKEGLLREHSSRWGKFEDLVAYGILYSDSTNS
ncbi:GNAT family N-acetyltransferase [Rubritalea sp.]|uniref:GNAT family N-acetyltransferase n=1 Tax=Rubritalea sp. TaxID=2109375 RepID=UPI003EF8CC60